MRASHHNKQVKMYKSVTRKFFKRVTFTEDSTWVVPENVTSLIVDCVAGAGRDRLPAVGGKGGRVQCVVAVSPNEKLNIKVGKQYITGEDNRNDSMIYVNDDELQAVVQAGGGGSATYTTWIRNHASTGGAGGGLVGGVSPDSNPSFTRPAQGGTQTEGGLGAAYHLAGIKSNDDGINGQGARLTGGRAGRMSASHDDTGCGGGGYYGGGGGLADYYYGGSSKYTGFAGGGGGGSSYTDPNLCSEVVHTRGYQTGDGYVTISFEVDETEEHDYYTDTIIIKAFK